jgi:hypothetical protein
MGETYVACHRILHNTSIQLRGILRCENSGFSHGIVHTFFCDGARSRLVVVTNVSRQLIGPIFMDQAVQEESHYFLNYLILKCTGKTCRNVGNELLTYVVHTFHNSGRRWDRDNAALIPILGRINTVRTFPSSVFIIIQYSLRIGLPGWLFPSGCSTKTLCRSPFHPTHVTWAGHPILLSNTILTLYRRFNTPHISLLCHFIKPTILDFKLSPCFECRMLSSWLFPGCCGLTFRNCASYI